jgi:hypothetical protein
MGRHLYANLALPHQRSKKITWRLCAVTLFFANETEWDK